jgi:hypothetical protein
LTQQLNALVPLFEAPPTLLELMLTLFGPLWTDTLLPLLIETLEPFVGGIEPMAKPSGISTHGMPDNASRRACVQKSITSARAMAEPAVVNPRNAAADAMAASPAVRRTSG